VFGWCGRGHIIFFLKQQAWPQASRLFGFNARVERCPQRRPLNDFTHTIFLSSPASSGPDRLPLLPGGSSVLLDMPEMRLRHVPEVHG
jgi:hypothetical protein